MKIYVAGKFNEREKIREIQQALIAKGHSITYDWTTHESQIAAKTREQFQEDAKRDKAGIRACELMVFVFTDADYAYRGTFWEMGYADGLEKKVIILTSFEPYKPGALAGFQRCCFYHSEEHTFVTTEDELLSTIDALKTK
jgi:nucleoside 2-deoxyribosyltransferase